VSNYQNLLVETLEENILRIMLNRPQVMNALNKTTLEELLGALQNEASQSNIRCVILGGVGKAFCAGQDLEERRAFAEGGERPSLQQSLELRYNPLIKLINELPKPVIGMLNGVAAGAGCGLALACDMRLASPAASLMLSFVKVGLGLDSGVSYTLPRLLGMGRAFELAILGERISAHEAEKSGIINRVVEPDQLENETLGLARRIALGPPQAIARIKKALNYSQTATLAAALQNEAILQEEAAQGQEYPKGLRAFYAKRPPNFSI